MDNGITVYSLYFELMIIRNKSSRSCPEDFEITRIICISSPKMGVFEIVDYTACFVEPQNALYTMRSLEALYTQNATSILRTMYMYLYTISFNETVAYYTIHVCSLADSIGRCPVIKFGVRVFECFCT